MTCRGRALPPAIALAAWLCACGSDPVKRQPAEENPEPPQGLARLSVEVSPTTPTHVKLAVPETVKVTAPKTSTEWDLAFMGYDVMTNGGLSGPGKGWAFGPLSAAFFAFPEEPVEAPFQIEDGAGGAFLRWYAYDGTTHQLYSRYHVYGLRSGEHLYKLQVLGYYGEVQGAPVSALYQVRYAEVTASGSGETRAVHDLNGTLDGESADPSAATDCLVLATGETLSLSADQAAESLDWDVCFRREAISVNGGLGGPGDVTGVDLEAGGTSDETLAAVKKRTAKSEEARFDAVDEAALTAPGLEYTGDHVASAFTGKWADLRSTPPVPTPSTAFLVIAANGYSRFLVSFDSFDTADLESPGTVQLSVQKVVSQ